MELSTEEGNERFPLRQLKINYLLTAEAMFGKLLLMAVGAVHVVILGHEALRADWLVTLVAGETVLVPRIALVLHILRAYRQMVMCVL